MLNKIHMTSDLVNSSCCDPHKITHLARSAMWGFAPPRFHQRFPYVAHQFRKPTFTQGPPRYLDAPRVHLDVISKFNGSAT